MNRNTKKDLALLAAVAAASASALANCYDLSSIGKACAHASCAVGACATVVNDINEDAFTRVANPMGRGTTPKDFLCYQTYKTKNQFSQCVVENSCQGTVSGYLASGAFCPGGVPE